jgi:pyruvate kinase
MKPEIRRTKIVCTLGPASNSPDVIGRLVEAGMNVVRVNMSHGTRDEHAGTIARVRAAAEKRARHVPILMDLTGPKMRIGKLLDGQVSLEPGEEFSLTTRNVIGDRTAASINYPPLVSDVDPGNRILMGDGEIELRAISKTETGIRCEVVVGGELKSNKGINVPGVKLTEEVPTTKDIDDVRFGVEQGVDWFALSFVRYPREIERLREILTDHDSDIPIVVKIEKKEAVDNIDELLRVTNGVMIARGDLGLELPLEEVPLVQKDIISKAVEVGRPVITATQMLESMIENPRPTRAEAADVANAVFDGTDAVMLSGETAIGRYPVESVQTMARVAAASEERIDYAAQLAGAKLYRHDNIAEAIAHAACQTAVETSAKAIICCTRSGQTARLISRFRPPMQIVAVSPSGETLRRAGLHWNTLSVDVGFYDEVDDMINAAKAAVRLSGIARGGDRVVIVAGVPVGRPGTTNTIKADVL